ncbi:MAG TPA: FKBP-type peptidyl-prolyl cis-trans isomerase [Acidiferrobacterales bacterium]|jgi:FKBP-type peptidyl-prolyl cis-trans isomerase FklB
MQHRILVLGLIGTLAAAGCSQSPAIPQDDKQKLSYTIGHQVGMKIKEDGIDVDPALVAQGLSDVIGGVEPKLTEDEMRNVMMAYQQQRFQEFKDLADKNQKTGDEFLAENKKKDGVTTLASGLQYKVITAGKGRKPKASDTVVAHYRGTLLDGKEFDSSITRGEPATFPVANVIPGWQEALKLMPEGSKWEVYIPSNLAYGPRGAGANIGPNQTLVFEIELIKVQ